MALNLCTSLRYSTCFTKCKSHKRQLLTPPPTWYILLLLYHRVLSRCSLHRDVTDVFEAFHDDPWQRRKLEAFRVGTLVGYTPSPLVEDFRALKQEIADEGLFEVKVDGRVGGEVVARKCFCCTGCLFLVERKADGWWWW